MPYVVVEDFRAGLDVRRSVVTAKPGSLRELTNAFINAGGEVEKRRGLISAYSLPNGTIGLARIAAAPVVFSFWGSPPTMPAGVACQQVFSPVDLTKVLDSEFVYNSQYMVAKGVDGNIYHFWGSSNVTPPYPQAAYIRQHRNRLWSFYGNVLYFSALQSAGTWSVPTPGTPTSAGYIEVSYSDAGYPWLIGLNVYYNQLALLGRRAVQLWSMDEDPSKNQIIRSISNTGLVGPLAHTQVAGGDLLYLTDSGFRSLRARDASNQAMVTDLGSPIDDLIRPKVAAETAANYTVDARTAVDPLNGHALTFWGNEVWCLAMAPAADITAWSRWTMPFTIEGVSNVDSRLYVRSGNTIYLLGGWDNATYDNSEVVVTTPFMDAGTPATLKRWHKLDAALEGTWSVEIASDPTQPDVFEMVGTITGATFPMQDVGLSTTTTHVSLRLKTTDASRARIGKLILHYAEAE